jgi:hypothetical protein
MFNWEDDKMVGVLFDEWFLVCQCKLGFKWTVQRVGHVTGTAAA